MFNAIAHRASAWARGSQEHYLDGVGMMLDELLYNFLDDESGPSPSAREIITKKSNSQFTFLHAQKYP